MPAQSAVIRQLKGYQRPERGFNTLDNQFLRVFQNSDKEWASVVWCQLCYDGICMEA
jgi:hypothetical protein